MKKQKEIRITYQKNCPVCKKVIKGGSESAVIFNLEIHLKQKHGK